MSSRHSRVGVELQQIVLTVDAMPPSPDARRLPNRVGPSCLGGCTPALHIDHDWLGENPNVKDEEGAGERVLLLREVVPNP